MLCLPKVIIQSFLKEIRDMSEDFAIRVKGVTKKYRIGLKEEIKDSLAEQIFETIKYPFKQFKKLK